MRYLGRELTRDEVELLSALGSKCTDGWAYTVRKETPDLVPGRGFDHLPNPPVLFPNPSAILRSYPEARFFLLHEEKPL